MADKKISELNSAAAVYDADDFAVVQDAETKQVNASVVKAYVKDGLSKSEVGLGNVDNTSDANKPVSTATQTALDLKQDAASAATLTGTQTLTNKTISGSSNTLSNIGNSSLTNSSITINGNAVSLGGSTTVGTVTSVSGTGTVNGLALSGTVTSSGSLTLGGTLDLSSPPAIGGTTPAAGAFTTLSSTGNTTLGDASGDTLTINGTAVSAPNGLNVNSNELVLSGGNLGLGVTPSGAYRLEASGNVSLGSTSAATTTHIFSRTNWNYTNLNLIRNGSNTATPRFLAFMLDGDAVNNTTIGGYPAIWGIYSGTPTTGSTSSGLSAKMGLASYAGFNYYINGSQDMTLTSKGLLVGYTSDSGLSGTGNAIFSGNVGIGTSSPGDKLAVNGNAALLAGNYLKLFNSANSANSGLATDATGLLQFSATSVTRWLNNTLTTEQMRLDASGNLGLGVTPSAWISDYRALEIGFSHLYGRTGGSAAAGIAFNAHFDSSSVWRYTNSYYATAYQSDSGQHRWLTSGTTPGTAGNAIPFTEAMTLDASGNLLVGTTNTTGLYNGSSTNQGAYVTYYGSYICQVNNNRNAYFAKASGYTDQNYVQFFVAGNTVGSITTNGSSTAYNTSSDQRLKINITSAGSAVKSILDFPVDQFDWISDGSHVDFGAVAQKAINVIPEMVSAPSDPEEMWGIDWSKAVPRLIRAYQELHARLEALEVK